MNTHFTISAGLPHRKMIKHLAQLHREEEEKNQETINEYPNDFEEENDQNQQGYNLFAVLEERRKRNLVDLVKLCEKQLESKDNNFDHKNEGRNILNFSFFDFYKSILQTLH